MKLTKFLLKHNEKFTTKLLYVLGAVILLFGWFWVISKAYNALFETEVTMVPFQQFFMPAETYKHPILINLFYFCLIPPIFEEILCRKLPLDIVRATKKNELILPVILFTSTVFGLMHGDSTKILMQGVGGFLASCLYVKNGYSFWSAWLFHLLWNLTILVQITNF